MPSAQSDILPGTLDLLILKSLTLEQMHGMGISRRIAQITNGTFEVKAGSLFPALHRMEQAGWISSNWAESETKRRARFYKLTRTGRSRLHAESERWERISLAMASALRAV
jgi:PadR family transcriptional regulator, regulatory protein PadR